MLIIAAALFATPDASALKRAQHWAQKAKPIVTCVDNDQCDRRWKRGIAWIRANSRFNTSVDTPGLYSTYGAMYPSMDLAFVLVRRIAPDGSPSIAARAWCGNILSCSPKPKEALEELQAAMDGD